MKKTLFILALATGTTTYAQTSPQKGSWYTGGGVGFSSNSTKQDIMTTKRTSWSATPEAGVFISNQIQIGFGLTATGSKNTLASNNAQQSLQFGGAVYSRYLFGSSAFKPFVGINASYLTGQTKSSANSNKTTIGTMNVHFNAGFAYYLAPRVAVFGSVGILGYTNSVERIPGAANRVSNDFGFNFNTMGNRFTIGMYYTICEGKENL